MEGQKDFRFHQKYLHLGSDSEDKQRSHGSCTKPKGHMSFVCKIDKNKWINKLQLNYK